MRGGCHGRWGEPRTGKGRGIKGGAVSSSAREITVPSSGRGRGHGRYASGSALCCCGEPMGKGRKARIAPWVPDRGPVHGVHARKPVEDRQQRSAEQEKGAWCAPIDAVVAGRPRAQRWKRAAEQYAGCEGGVSGIARPPVITGQTKRDRAGRVEDDRASSLRRPIQCAHKLLQIFESA